MHIHRLLHSSGDQLRLRKKGYSENLLMKIEGSVNPQYQPPEDYTLSKNRNRERSGGGDDDDDKVTSPLNTKTIS